jgi:hypothetical protein
LIERALRTGCTRAAALAWLTRAAGSVGSGVRRRSSTGFIWPGNGSGRGSSTTWTGAGGSTVCTAGAASSYEISGGFCVVAQPASVVAESSKAAIVDVRKAGFPALRKDGFIVQAPVTS